MTKAQHPWQVGPTELIEFALERMHKGRDFDRRLAFLILDVGVETLLKSYLTLPESVTHFQIKRSERNAAVEGNFHELLEGVKKADPQKSSRINFPYIEHFHSLRNALYHQGNQVTAVQRDHLEGYAELAVQMLDEYLDVDLAENLKPPLDTSKDSDDPVVRSVEVEVSFGTFRIEQLKSKSIRALSVNTNTFETPVKPFLRAVIDELSLPVEFTLKSGREKNTRVLGKDVIDELKSRTSKDESRKPKNKFPLTIKAHHQGKTFSGELINIDGRVHYDGQEYSTPTGAAKSIATAWKQVNGWMFWKYENPKSGKWEYISKLRGGVKDGDTDL